MFQERRFIFQMNATTASVEKPKQSLAPIAQEVLPFLARFHEEFLKDREDLENSNVVDFYNKIVEKIQSYEDSTSVMIDFRVVIHMIESQLLEDERRAQAQKPNGEQSRRGLNIIQNYATKLIEKLTEYQEEMLTKPPEMKQ